MHLSIRMERTHYDTWGARLDLCIAYFALDRRRRIEDLCEEDCVRTRRRSVQRARERDVGPFARRRAPDTSTPHSVVRSRIQAPRFQFTQLSHVSSSLQQLHSRMRPSHARTRSSIQAHAADAGVLRVSSFISQDLNPRPLLRSRRADLRRTPTISHSTLRSGCLCHALTSSWRA